MYLLDAHQADARGAIAEPFRRAAARLGVGIVGSERYPVTAGSHAAIARRVARARADGVVVDGSPYSGAATLMTSLLARLGPRVAIMVGEQFNVRDLLDLAGREAHGVFMAMPDAIPDAGSLTPAAERFVTDNGSSGHGSYALQAAQSADVALQAIARSDGTRASVLRSLRSLRVKDGILGSFAFDRHGDMTPATVTILRVTGETPRELQLPDQLEGAVVERVIRVGAGVSG